MGAAQGGALPFVGLTGGLGAGKSTALSLLGELGAATISADGIVHELYRGEPLRSLVVERWGHDVLAADGSVDRQAVARHVFGDPEQRVWLEGVIWPLVGQRLHEFREASNALAHGSEGEIPAPGSSPASPRAAVVETPLLFEAGMAPLYDVTIAVVSPEGIRAERASARGHTAVNERDARQLSQDEKAERADHAVVNDGSVEQLRERLAAVLDAIARPA